MGVQLSNRQELRKAERRFRKSQLDSDLHSYQCLLSKFSVKVTAAKSSFYRRKLEASASDPCKLFNIFSSLLNPPPPPPPCSLTLEDFVTFFEEKVDRIHQSFPSVPTPSTRPPPLVLNQCFSSLSTDAVFQLIKSSNPTTCPLDPIPSALFQPISKDLLPFITFLINKSLASGKVPSTFKTARVLPILMKPMLDSSDVNNYRTVSLLSFLLKIVYKSTFSLSHTEQDPNQSGFKPAHSTETALIALTENLQSARSAKLSSVLIHLDLSAASDTVNHMILLDILTNLGISGYAWKWFKSYLEDRSYQVTWRGFTSSPCRLTTDAPQGSVLGPLLFSLYTRSLGGVISSHCFSYHCYADDTQLMLSSSPFDTQVSGRISACLSDISLWMAAHHLKLNPSKTELIFIPATTGPHHDLAISFENSLIVLSVEARSLGLSRLTLRT
ncbi:hypothetical protein SRHO_G00248070 [Serrasalmus rhombeus]